MARAAREARNAAKLRDHPHIVAVHDVVVEDGVPWMVMRLVEGRSLADLLAAEGPLPAPRVAEVAGALFRALEAAHAGTSPRTTTNSPCSGPEGTSPSPSTASAGSG